MDVVEPGINIVLRPLEHINELTIIISNSYFHNINYKVTIYINGGKCTTKATIKIKNCVFKHNGDLNTHEDYPLFALISVELPKFNVTLIVINCEFFRNVMKLLSANVLGVSHQSPSHDLASQVVII